MTPIFNSAIIIAVFYLFYLLVLKKETFFQWNRIFILFTLLLAAVIPWLTLDLSWWVQKPAALNFVPMQDVAAPAGVTTTNNAESAFNWIDLFIQIYLGGVFIFSMRFLLTIGQVVRIYQKGKKVKAGNYNLVLVDEPINPFSFFNHIYLPASFYQPGKNLEVILNHENVHQHQWHSLDRLWMELFLVYQWFNPLVWLLRKEMILVHEYLADRNLSRVQNQVDYQQSLLKHLLVSATLSLGSSFSTHIKDRIRMMNKKSSPNTSLFKYLFLLPIIMVMFFTCTREDVEIIQSKEETNHITGRAINPKAHENLSGIRIYIVGQDRIIRTDSDGFFELDVSGEEYTLIAEDKNYKPLRFTASSDVNQLELWMARIDDESESQLVYETTVSEKPVPEKISPEIPIKIKRDGKIYFEDKQVSPEMFENAIIEKRDQLLSRGANEDEIYASIVAFAETRMGLLFDLNKNLRSVSIRKVKYYLDREKSSDVVENPSNKIKTQKR